ncbi:MAG: DcrB-related protein [Ignavibacterium sp.]|nr:DcrB-related protein [Ignavibacterium sp.]
MKIPDYYRQFQSKPEEKKESEQKVESTSPDTVVKEQPKAQPKKVEDKTRPYNADQFSLKMLEDWQDKTIFTLTGPVTDGIQHNVIVNVDPDCPFDNVNEYAEWQIKTLVDELKGCILLKEGSLKLDDGSDAYEAVFSWYPTDLRIYQHQVYTLKDNTAYKMTASFTKKTRQTIGPSVVRMMLSFKPGAPKK